MEVVCCEVKDFVEQLAGLLKKLLRFEYCWTEGAKLANAQVYSGAPWFAFTDGEVVLRDGVT